MPTDEPETLVHADSYRKGYADALSAAEKACREFRIKMLHTNKGNVEGRVFRHGAAFGARRCVDAIGKLKGGGE